MPVLEAEASEESLLPRAVVLDVGHGSCAVITDGRSTTVIDAGPGSGLMEFLIQSKISSIDSIVLSHADHDHIGGLIAIFASGIFTVAEVWLNSDSVKETRAWENLLFEIQHLEEAGLLKVNGSISFRNEVNTNMETVTIRVLAPRRVLAMRGPGSKDPGNRRVSHNGASAVLLVSLLDEPVLLLTGDMDAVGFDQLKGTGHDLRAEYLVLPHHGGLWGAGADSGSLVEELCRLVQPKEVIVSNGRGKFQNPNPLIIEAVRKSTPSAHISCTQLSKGCRDDVTEANSSLDNSVFSAGSNKNACCAGSVVVTLGEIPRRDHTDHKLFVDTFSNSALCRRLVGSATYE